MSEGTGRIYDKREWRRVRKVVFKRDGYRCVFCGRRGALQCHHKIRGGGPNPFDPELLVTSCGDCHQKETARERDRRSGERKKWDSLVEGVTG